MKSYYGCAAANIHNCKFGSTKVIKKNQKQMAKYLILVGMESLVSL
jgi:hypothetical protein